ncbi:Zinc finger PHD-type domain-containing protein [Caenorhabditis elegans]|uniref:Zinc finger PHD-type domain-containing protein n=1 Tax=Caenorhabditis elegans TaxID=6239 RepID=Q19511_CAEEL|nr:Zinc finger PHD-type domain-containing protein [Caenorhabditis elegans]CAA92158.2 Zinc finger PHD-type domain-containing protein [Caenorhabditis elegans]|eukprot:NP_001355360.1 PHd Finger family [Caenorhabditis elegans]
MEMDPKMRGECSSSATSEPDDQNWLWPEQNKCGMCADGGTIIWCETCPASFHAFCLGLKTIPEPEKDTFICHRDKISKNNRLAVPSEGKVFIQNVFLQTMGMLNPMNTKIPEIEAFHETINVANTDIQTSTKNTSLDGKIKQYSDLEERNLDIFIKCCESMLELRKILEAENLDLLPRAGKCGTKRTTVAATLKIIKLRGVYCRKPHI